MSNSDELAKLKALEEQIRKAMAERKVHEAVAYRPLIEEKQQTASEIMATMQQQRRQLEAAQQRANQGLRGHRNIPGVEQVGLKGHHDIGEITVVIDLENGEQIQIKLGDMIHPDQIQVFRDMAETGLGNVERPRAQAGAAEASAFMPNKWGDDIAAKLKENLVMSNMSDLGKYGK